MRKLDPLRDVGKYPSVGRRQQEELGLAPFWGLGGEDLWGPAWTSCQRMRSIRKLNYMVESSVPSRRMG